MDKGLFIFGSLIVRTMIFALISYVINLSLLKKIKNIDGMKNLVFGVQITLIGIISLYVVWNYTFYSVFWSNAMRFIPVYLITTGFIFGLIGYLDKSTNE